MLTDESIEIMSGKDERMIVDSKFSSSCDQAKIHRKKKDGGCTFYHNTLRTKHMERYGFMEVVPTLTALLLSCLNDLLFFFVFLYALFEFSCAKNYR